jgi:hypothetical protein
MKQALISPNEPRENGYRVAEVVEQPFEVNPVLFWVECADDVVADVYYYDPATQQIVLVPVPEPEPVPELVQPTTTGAQEL